MLLPEELSDHLVSVAMKPAAYRLVVFTDSAAWCTRLRYFAPVLSRRAEQLVGHQLQIRFLPIAVEVPPAEQPPPAIPADEINRMREMLKD